MLAEFNLPYLYLRHTSGEALDLEGSQFLEVDDEQLSLGAEENVDQHHAGIDEGQDITCILNSPDEDGAPLHKRYANQFSCKTPL